MKKRNIISILTILGFLLSPLAAMAHTGKLITKDGTSDVIIITEEDEEPFKFMHGERRLERPINVQLIGTFGAATPYSGAPGGGLHLGYQLSKAFYIGFTSSSFIGGENQWDDSHRYEYDKDDNDCRCDRKVYGQDGVKDAKSKLDPIHLIEVRVTPWDFGLYFSFGAMHRGKQESTITFKSKEREIGENTYTTGLEAVVGYEAWSGMALGLGFNHIFDSGFSLGFDYSMGLVRQTADVEVSSTATVSEDDLTYWKKQIKSNEKQIPYLCSISLGYAF